MNAGIEKKRSELMEEWGLSVDQINEVFAAAERMANEVTIEDINKVLKDLLRDPNWAVRTFTETLDALLRDPSWSLRTFAETLEALNEYFKEFGLEMERDHFFKWSLERAAKKEVE